MYTLTLFVYDRGMDESEIFQRALHFVRKKHRGQFRAGRTPSWHHLMRVSALLDFVLTQTKEGTATERVLIILAALGHDLIEDTDAKETEIRNIFGARGLELILGMTNTWGDKNAPPYVKKIIHSEEAVRLIKLADLYDNIANVTYCFKTLGRKWVASYFLQIVLPMKQAIVKTKFYKYKEASIYLIFWVNTAMMLLEKEHKTYNS